MKRGLIVAAALFFVSIAGFAQAPSPVPLTEEALAAILGPSASNSSCATQESVLLAAKLPELGPCGGPLCCACEDTGGCFACCRCGGGSIMECAEECG